VLNAGKDVGRSKWQLFRSGGIDDGAHLRNLVGRKAADLGMLQLQLSRPKPTRQRIRLTS